MQLQARVSSCATTISNVVWRSSNRVCAGRDLVHHYQRRRLCAPQCSSQRPAQPPADDDSQNTNSSSSSTGGSSSGGNGGAAGAASTSYLLPWETEPPSPPPNYASIVANIGHMDNNQLQTALGVAIAAEDYVLAARIKDRLQAKLLESGSSIISKPLDWRALGVPGWLADRAERLGFMFPTEVQRRATPVILSGSDCVIASETGSGKTAAFLIPALCQLDYPPDLFPEDLEGPQLLLLVPSFELGVQACMLLYKLWGGNISSRTPGDPANMFSYTGPPGIKVRGVLNDEEVQIAATSRYLRGVHALVATPDMALALLSLPDSPLSFQDLRAVVVDEMDALLDAYPASFGQLLDAAVHRFVPPNFQQGAGAQGVTAVGLDADDSSPPSSSSSGGGGSVDNKAGGAGDAASGSSSSSSTGGGDGGSGDADASQQQQGTDKQRQQDNLSRLKALLSEQQRKAQQQQQQQGPGVSPGASEPGLPGQLDIAAGSNARLAAAAARLEGLLSAPAATPAGKDAQPQQEQQQQQQQGASSEEPQGQQQQQQQQMAGGAAAVSAAGSSSTADNDDPMPKPQVVLVGATISEDDITLALNRGWVTEPVVVRVGSEGCVPAGLKHRAIIVGRGQQRLGGLVASLRKDLSGALAAADAAAAGDSSSTDKQQQQQQPVRVIIFARSEDEARAAAEPLRAALWGDHMLSVLLPSTGAEPVKALTAFRDRVASLLLATPSAARGLDLPAISHVYSIGLPQDATEYVHRAGRAGRIGSTAGGEVVSVVTREELPELVGMVSDELGLHLDVVDLEQQGTGLGLLGSDWADARQGLLGDEDGDEASEDGSVGGAATSGAEGGEEGQQREERLEAARKGLEDLFNLL